VTLSSAAVVFDDEFHSANDAVDAADQTEQTVRTSVDAAASAADDAPTALVAAASSEWLNQRVRLHWAGGALASAGMRCGVVTRLSWLPADPGTGAGGGCVLATIRFDDGETVDGEALGDLLHESLSSAHVSASVASPLLDDSGPIEIDDRPSGNVAGVVLDSLISQLCAPRDQQQSRSFQPGALLDDAYAACEAPAISVQLQQLICTCCAIVAESRVEESWTQRSFAGAGTSGPATLPAVRQGLQAARIVLRVAGVRDLPAGWVTEDALEATLHFARAVFIKAVVPLFDATGEALQKQNAKLGLSHGDGDGDGDNGLTKPKSTQWARAGVELVSQLLVLLAHVLKHAAAIVQQRSLSDVLLLTLTSFAHATLFVDQNGNAVRVAAALELLQLSAVQTLRSVFRRYPLHRAAILDDLSLSLSRLPKGKKNARSYRVLLPAPGRAPTADAVQMTTALIVQLLQCCAAVSAPVADAKPEVKDEGTAADVKPEPAPNVAAKGGKRATAAAKNHDFDAQPVAAAKKKGKRAPPPQQQQQQQKASEADVAEAEAAAAAAQIAVELEASAAATKQQKAAPDSAETPGQMARYLLTPIVSRCATSKDEAGHKAALENLVRDLLLLWPLAEWPGAETALLALARLLMRSLASTGNDGGGDAADAVASSAPLRELALSLLGQIGARVQEVAVATGGEVSLGVAGVAATEPQTLASTVVCCVCCARFLVDSIDQVGTADWCCAACQARSAFADLRAEVLPPPPPVKVEPAKAAKGKKRKAASDGSEHDAVAAEPEASAEVQARARADLDELVAKKLVLNWLTVQAALANESGEAGDVLLDAQRTLLARWHLRARVSNDTDSAALLWHHFERCVGVKPPREALVFGDAESRRLARELLLQCGALAALFPLLLRTLLQLLSEPSKAVRARALKALSSIADANPTILLEGAARRAVSDRCLDTATSVRESALSLLGKYMLQSNNEELIRQFMPVVLERARDTGVSVRKSVVAILRELCVRAPGHARVVQICRTMVQRINDVPTVSSAILRTFELLWFAPAADGASLAQRCDQIGAVCAVSSSSSDWLVDLMTKLLDSPVPATAAATRDICTQLVALLAKRVVDFDELRSAAGADDASDAQFLAALAALGMFVRARPALALPHVLALAHYLRVPNVRVDAGDARAVAVRRTDVAAALRVTALLEQCAPLLASCDVTFLARVESDLSSLISSQGLAMVESSISCLGKLVTHVTLNRALMLDLLAKCVKFVEPRRPGKQAKPVDARDKPMLLRCICVIGLLVQHYDFDGDASHDFGDAAVVAAAASRGDRNVTHAFELLRAFVPDTNEEDVRVRAVRSLCAVLARRPALLLDKAIAWLLRGAEPSWKVTEAVLEGLHELLRLQQLAYASPLEPLPQIDEASEELVSEDEGVVAAAAAAAPETDEKAAGAVVASAASAANAFVSMHDASDTSVVSTQMQLAMPSVLAHFGHARDEVRLQALRLTTMATRMGIINPLLCVPASLALLADANDELAKAALVLLAYVHGKHANMLHLRLVDGVRGAYQQQRARIVAARTSARLTKREATIAGSVRAINVATHEAKFARLYQLLEANRRQREAFVSGVVAQLELDTRHERIDVPYVAFLCELLASLPYRALPEVLEAVCVAHRVVSLQGSGVVRQCERLLATAAAAATATATAAPSELHNACNAAAALSLLVYLKRFLKRAWGLSAEQLREHGSLATTRAVSKVPPVRRHEGELLGSSAGFADVLLESGGDAERMKAQHETLAQLMEEELDDHFDVHADDEDDPAAMQASADATAGQRKRGRPRKNAAKSAPKKQAKAGSVADADVVVSDAENLDDEAPDAFE
jgi:hypothetical protein